LGVMVEESYRHVGKNLLGAAFKLQIGL
jgi:hypothetical protein